jgi:hypothetical protein
MELGKAQLSTGDCKCLVVWGIQEQYQEGFQSSLSCALVYVDGSTEVLCPLVMTILSPCPGQTRQVLLRPSNSGHVSVNSWNRMLRYKYTYFADFCLSWASSVTSRTTFTFVLGEIVNYLSPVVRD